MSEGGIIFTSQQTDENLTGANTRRVTFGDVDQIGPDDLAGRYLRQFWQPVMHSHDLEAGRALPLNILDEQFTIYRGESGKPFVISSRCPHRSAPMHAGWVQGDEIRCFYHGWKFAGDGTCTEQPAERPAFCERAGIKSYPTQEYIGLIFVFFGEGEPPEMPRYPAFDSKDVVVTYDTYKRPCSYYNNLENSGDFSHIAFTHSTLHGSWDESNQEPTIIAEESPWGVTMTNAFPDGRRIVYQFGMPNILHARVLPDDANYDYREFLAIWVPIDDDNHIQFTLTSTPNVPGKIEGYLQRRAERFAGYDQDPVDIARKIVSGQMKYEDVDPKRVWLVVLQDNIVQTGVGRPSRRPPELLGRSDACVLRQRRVWLRELQKFADGKPLKQWRYDPAEVPVHSEFFTAKKN